LSNGRPRTFGLYGQPVSQSLSPLMFNRTFKAQGTDCSYLAFEVPPEQLQAAVQDAKALGFAGFNVTMPHKVAIVPLLDKISNEASEIGSVNTVVRNTIGLEGHNTDGEGALRALRVSGFEPRKSKTLIIGAGGAARAIVHKLSSEAESIVVLDRNREKSETIANRTKGAAKTYSAKLSKTELEKNIRSADLIVNATPLGTVDLLNAFNIPLATIRDKQWVFDLAYGHSSRENTSQLRVHALELLLQQAALSYELWFGNRAPLDLMRSILAEHNGGDWR
jgi:shikimate dehydrogenase